MVLVVGATGQLGGRIVRELLSRKQKVRALCRPGSGYGALERMGAEIVMGDLKDPASLAQACAGAGTVITTANTSRRGGDDTVQSVDLDGTRSLIEAAAGSGSPHVVYVSVYGASADSPVPFLAAKGHNEAFLRASGLPWTVLAPNAFMESWPGVVVGAPVLEGRPVVLVGSGLRRHAYIAAHDVAQLAVAAILEPAARNRHIAIGGPAAWTWPEVVAVYEQVLGRTIDVTYVKPGDTVDGVRAVLLQLLAMYDTFDTNFDSTAVASEFGVTLTPLDAWVRASVATTTRVI